MEAGKGVQYAYQSGPYESLGGPVLDPYCATEEGPSVGVYEYGSGVREELRSDPVDEVVDINGPERSWFKEFIALMQKLRSPVLSAEDRSILYGNVAALFNDFVYVSTHCARTIVEELRLPQEKKSIRAVDVGGLAGGTKFLHNNILFKLPQDPLLHDKVTYLFGGAAPCSYLASKSAGRELTAFDAIAIELVGDGERISSKLNTPLCCLVDYRGYRVFAVTVLPVSKEHDTLVLGSADGGMTVRNSDFELAAEMRRVTDALYLAPHLVQGTEVFGGGDVEVHRGQDGRGYLIDLARLLPPTAPEPGQLKSKVFCNMFRPELLKRLKRQGIAAPLSSDAFAGWGLTDPLRRQREHDIRAATNFLFDVVIPEVAKELSTLQPEFTFCLSSFLHQHGVNLRYLDRLYYIVDGVYGSQWRVLIGTEMYARLFKRELRELLRSACGESESRRVVANFLTLIRTSYSFWKECVPKILSSEPSWEKCNPVYNPEHLCNLIVKMLGVQVARFETRTGIVTEEAKFLETDLSLVLPVDILRWDPVVRKSGISEWMAGLSLLYHARNVMVSRVQHKSALSFFLEAFKVLKDCAIRLTSVNPAKHALVAFSYILELEISAVEFQVFEERALMNFSGMDSEASFGICVAILCNSNIRVKRQDWLKVAQKCVEACGADALHEFGARFFAELFRSGFGFMWEFLVAHFSGDWSSQNLARLLLTSIERACHWNCVKHMRFCLGLPSEASPIQVLQVLFAKILQGKTRLPEGFCEEHNVLIGPAVGIRPKMEMEEWPPLVFRKSRQVVDGLYSWMEGLELLSLKRLHVFGRVRGNFRFETVRAPNLVELSFRGEVAEQRPSAAIVASMCTAFTSVRCVELVGSRTIMELGPLHQILGLEELRLRTSHLSFTQLEALLQLGRIKVLQITDCEIMAPLVPDDRVCCASGHACKFQIPYQLGSGWSCEACQEEYPQFAQGYHCDPCGWDMCSSCAWARFVEEGPGEGFRAVNPEQATLHSLKLSDVRCSSRGNVICQIVHYLACDVLEFEFSPVLAENFALLEDKLARVRGHLVIKSEGKIVPHFESLSNCEDIEVSCFAALQSAPAILSRCKSFCVGPALYELSEADGAAFLPQVTTLDVTLGEKGVIPKTVQHLVLRGRSGSVLALSHLPEGCEIKRLSLYSPVVGLVKAATLVSSIKVLDLKDLAGFDRKCGYCDSLILLVESLPNLRILIMEHLIEIRLEEWARIFQLPKLRVLKLEGVNLGHVFWILFVLLRIGVCNLRLLSFTPFPLNLRETDLAEAIMLKFRGLVMDQISHPQEVVDVMKEELDAVMI